MPASQRKYALLFLFAIIAAIMCPSSVYAQDENRGLIVAAAPIAASEPVGQQYAVFIAIDRYKEWPPLKNAVSDAEHMRTVLEKRYYIDQVYTLYDDQATKEKVMQLFENLSIKLRPEDSLFVFYAGHGSMDPVTQTGSWILQDGGTSHYEQRGWLPNSQIRNVLRNIRSKHVLLVSDSCFSGDILNVERGSQIQITDEYFKKAYARRSRQVLTSGAEETVPDESVFTRALVRLFEENTKPYLDPLMLFNEIRLTQDLTTSPLLGTLRDTDSQEGGSFIFFLKQAQPAQLRLQYDPNGATMGSVPVDSGLYTPGSIAKVLSPGSLLKSGYEFAGWNTMPDGSGADVPADSILTLKDANITLYARWVPVSQCRIIYDSNSATSGKAPVDEASYAPGELVIARANTGSLGKTGYSFAGWNTKPDGSGTDVPEWGVLIAENKDITLYARWIPVSQYRIIYDGNGATSGNVPYIAVSYKYGEYGVVSWPGSLSKSDYEFAGWNTKADGTGISYRPGDTITISGADITLYARWVPASQHRIIYSGNGATSGTEPYDAVLYKAGEKAKLYGPGSLSKSGYEFVGWNTKADGTGISYKPGDMITIALSDAILYAQWKQTVALKQQTGWIDFSNVPPNTDIYLDGEYFKSISEFYSASNFEQVPTGNHKVELVYRYSLSLLSSFYEILEVSVDSISKPRESLNNLADYLEEKKRDAEEYQSKTKARSAKVFFSLASLGAAGICYLTGQSAYANYQSASDPTQIAAYRSQAEFLSGAAIASLVVGAIFTIQIPIAKVPPKPHTSGILLDQYIKDLDLTITSIRAGL